MNETHFWSISQLGQAYRRGDLRAEDVTRSQLDRIDATQTSLNAYALVLADRALAQAKAADLAFAAGIDRGPLQGVPIGIKDLIDLKGHRTSAGSPFFGSDPAPRTATLAQRLEDSGSVILGKNTMHEFAAGGPLNRGFGQTYNPWDRDRYTGGSSSGSGVATAAGLAYASIGSDTAGSIRFPAAYCGVTGIKPTYGRVPFTGTVPLAWSFDHFGPLARSAEDCAVVLQAIAGHDPDDRYSALQPVPRFANTLNSGVAGLRIGLPRPVFFENLDPETADAIGQALDVLRQLGATVQDTALPDAKEAVDLIDRLLWPEIAAVHETLYPAHATEYDPLIARRIESGLGTAAPLYINAQRRRASITASWSELLNSYDVLALPSVQAPAERVDEVGTSVRAQRLYYTWPFDLTGFPAISVPCGFSRDGMPLSIQFVGKHWDEGMLFRTAHAYQQVTDWHLRHPVI